MGCDAKKWMDLAQYRELWWAYVRAVMNLSVSQKTISQLVSLVIISIFWYVNGKDVHGRLTVYT